MTAQERKIKANFTRIPNWENPKQNISKLKPNYIKNDNIS